MAISIPTLSGSYTLGGQVTISTNRTSNNYRHSLYYSWGAAINNVFIDDGITDSYTWTIPKNLANSITRATAGTIYFKLVTNDISTGQSLGSYTISKTITVPNTNEFKPSISDITLTEAGNVAASLGLWVAKQSKIQGLVNATQAYSSPITNVKIEANGTIYKELNLNFTTDFLVSSGSMSIKATITDARGRSKSYTKTITVQAYDIPYITTATVTRASSTTATLKLVGGISSVNNTNTKSYYYKYKLKTDSYYGDAVPITNNAYTINQTITVTGLTDTQYDFLVGIQDAYTSTEKSEINLPSTSKIFNISADKKKFAFFGKAVLDGVQFFSNIYDKFGQVIRNGVAFYESGGSTDPDTSLEEIILTATNTPTDSESIFWFIKTMFYNTKSTSTNRTQIAYPYNSNNPSKIYYRTYNGSWSSWMAVGGNTTDNGIIKIGNNICIQYGGLTARVDTANTVKNIEFYFNTPFNVCYELIPILESSAIPAAQVGRGVITASKGAIWFNRTNTSATSIKWVAIGKLSD